MNRRVKHVLRIAFGVAVTIALVAFARSVDWAATWRAVHHADPLWLAVAALVNLVSLALKGLRWGLFLRAIGSPSFGLAVRATVVGSGVDNILVANSGDASRVLALARKSGLPKSAVLATLIVERLFDVLSFTVILLVTVLGLPSSSPLAHWKRVALGLLVGILVLFTVLIWKSPDEESVVAFLRPTTHESLAARVRHTLKRFFVTAAALASVPRFLAAGLLSVLTWSAQVATYHLTAVAAHFPITVSGTVAALLAVNVGLVVRATPGNVGLFQLVYAATAASLSLSKDAAIGVAFLIQIIQIVPVTGLALLLAPSVALRRKDVEELAHEQPAGA